MKKYRGWLIFIIFLALCAGVIHLTLRVTAEYPTLGEQVSYPVNQVEGFTLTIGEPTWSPFRGYSIRWKVTADSEDVYCFETDGPGCEYLERRVNGQWYRLGHSQDNLPFNSLELAVGGMESGTLEGSIVQKYDDYGTRLEAGNYRVVLEMKAADETPYYLAADFDIS